MRIECKVELEDGTAYEVVANSRDIRAWEREYGESWLTTPASEVQYTQLVYLALKRTGQITMTYDEFDARADDVNIARVRALIANPTQPEASEDSSVDSPSG